MAVPTVLTNASPGAPALTGQDGSLYSVLKWALPILGWTLEFDDPGNFRAAFRNSPLGTGNFLRLADQAVDHDGDQRMANVRSYATMTDADTGQDEVGASNWMVLKSFTADTTPRTYIIAGDDKSFLFCPGSGNVENLQYFYFGDIAPDRPGDEGAFLTTASADTTVSSATLVVSPWISNSGLSGFSQLRYDLDQSLVGLTASLDGDFGMDGTSGSAGIYPEPATGGIRVADRPLIETRSGGHRRGRFRGFLDIVNNVLEVWPTQYIIEGQATPRGAADCMVVNHYPRVNNATGRGVFLIDISTDWDNW